MTDFLGVAFGVAGENVCALATSDGYGVADLAGLSSADVLAFLWSTIAARASRTVVGFEVSSDLELAFQDFSAVDKDVLFGIVQAKEKALPEDLPIRDWQVALKPGVVIAGNYRVSMIPGKLLRLSNGKSSAALYDISSFFEGCDLAEALAQYQPDAPTFEKVARNALPLWQEDQAAKLLDRCQAEGEAVATLAAGVDSALAPLELGMRQWYGPSAVAGRCLNKWKARKQAKRLNTKNTVYEQLKAIDCAYFGSRVEQVKLGTIADVRVFDLNSAYAYATTLLSQFYSPLRFTRQYSPDVPFSVWLVDYDLPKTATLGILPTRSPRGGISYRGRGRGYFWQPEVDYLVQRYPGSFRVKWGYIAKDYDPVTFATDIAAMYDYRIKLKTAGDKHEKVIKLSLSNLYGKFAQNSGTAYYQCRAWAGWITALIRRLLLEAVTGIEESVICFSQDAIHLQGVDAQVHESRISAALGHYKRQRYAQGFYVAPGIYDLSDTLAPGKQAARGASLALDFERIASDLSARGVTELTREFFVGWQLNRKAPLKYDASYLTEIAESLDVIPSKAKARNYETGFDWQGGESGDSKINRRWSGLLSSRYLEQQTTPAARLRVKDRGWL